MENNKFYKPERIADNPRPFNFTMGNRNAGKSFGWKKFVIENFLKNKDKTKYCKFMFMYRDVGDVKLVSPYIFDDVLNIYFPDLNITFKKIADGYGEYKINGELAGFAIAIKKYITFKRMPILQEVEWGLMDEFLVEDGKYIQNEFDIVRNLYQTCARGNGETIRSNCHFVFISNTVSMVNPYFSAFPEIKASFKFNTRKIIRDSFLLEMVLNEKTMEDIKNSEFGKAIEGTKYGLYALNNDFYNDNTKFIEKVKGKKTYVYTYVMAGQSFGVYRCDAQGLFYISRSVDKNAPIFVFDNDDHDVNFIFLQQRETYIKVLDNMYRRDCVRFEDLDCKMSFLTLTGLLK